MRIGIPKEVKNHEHRVGLTPASVLELTKQGHKVVVQKSSGAAIGLADSTYIDAGASIVETSNEVFRSSELIVKVKELQPEEYELLREDHTLFCYLHLAADPEQTDALIKSGATCIAYETVTAPGGGLPLLAPMSEIAGRMSIQAGACHLEKSKGGMGRLLGGVAGVAPGQVTILGAGVVGMNALQIAVGMGARVTVIDKNVDRLRQLDLIFGNRISTLYSSSRAVEDAVSAADLVIGGVLIPGASAPKLVTREMLKRMREGSVLVDVAIDQGGCFETSHATTHESPTYVIDGVIHYCVANMPGAVAQTSTFALNNATINYVSLLAEDGLREALRRHPSLKNGLNVCRGRITHEAVANSLGYEYFSPDQILYR